MATNMVSLYWKYNGIKQVVQFANLDDAKMCYQILYANGIAAGYSVPEGYKIPLKRYSEDGILSEVEMVALKAKLDKMTLVH